MKARRRRQWKLTSGGWNPCPLLGRPQGRISSRSFGSFVDILSFEGSCDTVENNWIWNTWTNKRSGGAGRIDQRKIFILNARDRIMTHVYTSLPRRIRNYNRLIQSPYETLVKNVGI